MGNILLKNYLNKLRQKKNTVNTVYNDISFYMFFSFVQYHDS